MSRAPRRREPLSPEAAKARELLARLRRISRDLVKLYSGLPLPTPEEFEAIRTGESPWPEEAYLAAVLRNSVFHLEQAGDLLDNEAFKTAADLRAIWRAHRFAEPAPYAERSLRYLVQDRYGVEIERGPLERLADLLRSELILSALVNTKS